MNDQKANLDRLKKKLEDAKDQIEEGKDKKQKLILERIRQLEAELADTKARLEEAKDQLAKVEKIESIQIKDLTSNVEGEVKDKFN